MFDIGLLELLIIAIVSIVVLGPDKLPTAVRSGAKTFYWFKKQAASAKNELNKAFDLNDVYQDSRNEEILDNLENPKD